MCIELFFFTFSFGESTQGLCVFYCYYCLLLHLFSWCNSEDHCNHCCYAPEYLLIIFFCFVVNHINLLYNRSLKTVFDLYYFLSYQACWTVFSYTISCFIHMFNYLSFLDNKFTNDFWDNPWLIGNADRDIFVIWSIAFSRNCIYSDKI